MRYTATISTVFCLISRSHSFAPQPSSRFSFRIFSSAMSPVFKKAKLDDTKASTVIGTHSGTFQADEAMGCWMLRQIPAYRNAKVVRSRDIKILDECNIVIDVGGTYDHSKLRYDHHQRGYDERFSPKKGEEERCTKLSASGLVYRHYGKEVLQAHYPDLTGNYLDLAYTKLYGSFLEALDAIDTGVEMVRDGVQPLWKDSTGLSRRVARLNPRWNEEDENGKSPDPDERFAIAMETCGQDFMAVLTAIVESDIPARGHVEKALQERAKTDPSKEIICFPSGGLPWRNHLYDLEKEMELEKLIKFVLYTDQGGMWRVQAVTVEGQAFQNRLSLPEAWRGVRDEELEGVCKIPGARFVHAAGFIGGASTYEGALAMAKAGLATEKSA